MELFHAFPLFAHDFPIKSSIEKGGPARDQPEDGEVPRVEEKVMEELEAWKVMGHVIGKPWLPWLPWW